MGAEIRLENEDGREGLAIYSENEGVQNLEHQREGIDYPECPAPGGGICASS